MASIMTNASAMTALQTLSQTNKQMEVTQARISTGLKVATASDNAAYWSIATTMRSDNKALSTVQDALGLGAATVDVAYTALESSVDVLDEIKKKLVAAKEPGVDKGKIQSEITALQDQLESIGNSAVFSGENWLSVDSSATGYGANKSVVASFSRSADGAISIGTIEIDTSTTKLFDAKSQTTAAQTAVDTAITTYSALAPAVATAQAGVTTATATLAAATAALAADDGSDAGVTATLAAAVTTATTGLATANTTLTTANTALAAGAAAFETTADANGGILDKARVSGTTVAEGGVAGMDIASLTNSVADQQVLSDYITMVDQALAETTSAASDLGAAKMRVGLQQDFISSLTDAIERGVGQLVDADMNEESTRLQALQVQQQLGIQALSIANSNSQNILSLFR